MEAKRQKLTEANEAYRKGNPIMSDAEYDALQKEIGQDDSVLSFDIGNRKEKLPVGAYSLNKVKSIDELRTWAMAKGVSGMRMVITPKFDGVSLLVNERTGAAWTRGDGQVGQRSDSHFKRMKARLIEEDMLSRGEAIMSKEDFKKYAGDFKNARNLVAGLLNSKNPGEAIKDIQYVRYDGGEYTDKAITLQFLQDQTTGCTIFKTVRISEITPEYLDKLYTEWSNNFEIDGLVIEIDQHETRVKLGSEANNNPAYAVAYKNPAWSSSAIVKVKGVEWNVSKQGYLKPVINIEPTTVAGVTISNVTGYNAAYIVENFIAEDSVIEIIRSGDVIPKHINTISSVDWKCDDLIDESVICPSCGELTVWNESAIELICHNPDCKQKRIAKILHFFQSLKVEDFGEPSIIKLYDEGFDTIEKILKIEANEMACISGFGITSSRRFTKAVSELLAAPVLKAKLMHALDLFEGVIGSTTAQLIFDSKENLWERQSLLNIKGVGEASADAFINGIIEFHNPENPCFEVQCLFENVNIESEKQEILSDEWVGQKVCFTGVRDKALEQAIVSGGGGLVSGVSRLTTMLIVKDNEPKTLSSSKAVKAAELGIKIVEINKFK